MNCVQNSAPHDSAAMTARVNGYTYIGNDTGWYFLSGQGYSEQAGSHFSPFLRTISELESTVTLATQRAEAAKAVVEDVVRALGCEPGDDTPEDSTWWLPAYPGAVECDTLADVVRAAQGLAAKEIERVEAERDALRTQLEEIHEREAACCGEDESFDERIQSLTIERDALRKDAAQLEASAQLLARHAGLDCENVHHDEGHQHGLGDPCPVEAVIATALRALDAALAVQS